MVCKYCNRYFPVKIGCNGYSGYYQKILCSKCWDILDDIPVPDYIPEIQYRKFQLKTYETSRM